MNITYIEKDKVLNCLCSGELVPESHYSLNLVSFLNDTGLDTKVADAILVYFSRIGLVSDVNYRYHAPEFYLTVHMEAFDFHNHGGFYAQEELLTKNIEKLLLEIEKLKPRFKAELLTNITTIGHNILMALSFFKS